MPASKNVEGTPLPTKRGRGVSNETRSSSERKFHVSDVNKDTRLFLGALCEVKVTFREFKDDETKTSVFKGLKVPRLSFRFQSLYADPSQRSYVYKSFDAVESSVETIPGGSKAWRVESAILSYIKYFLDVYYLKGRELTDEEVDALTLPLNDVDDEGLYNPVEPQEVVDAYTTLFTNVAKIFNTGKDGKPVFLSDKGAVISTWMKLITCYKAGDNWKHVADGLLAFPLFVGEGVIEFKKEGVPPMLNLNGAIESVANVISPKQPTALPAMPGAAMVGTGGMYTPPIPTGSSAFPTDDLPF